MEIFGQGLTDHFDTFMHHAYVAAAPGYINPFSVIFGILLFSLLIGVAAVWIYIFLRKNPSDRILSN